MADLWQQTATALDRGDFTLLDDLLKQHDASIIELLDANNASDEQTSEAFTWACFTGRTTEAEALLDRGVDPAAGFKTGMAGFHWAVNRGNLVTVRMLIRRRAPLEQLNIYDGTVLSCTLWSAIHEHRDDHAPIVEELIDAGAEFESDWAAWWNDQPVPSEETKRRIAAALVRGKSEP